MSRRAGNWAPFFLFALSGFSGLAYEIVWTRRLVLVFGATVESASTVLAGFMAGFAFGSLLGGWLTKRYPRPLRVYGFLELGVAVSAALFPLAIHGILAVVESTSLPIGPVRFALTFAALLPPTILMGASFPVLVEAVRTEDPGRGMGSLYAANLFGACAGVLGSAFFLVAFLGLAGTHWLAVALSAVTGVVALLLKAPSGVVAKKTAPRGLPRAALSAVFVSGLCGMALETVWTRILVPSFNNSAYGFASVLFVFLLGLGIGSRAAAVASRWNRPATLGALLLAAGVLAFLGYSGYEVTQLLQMRFADMEASGVRPLFLEPLLEALLLILPVAIAQGMVLPVAARLSGGDGSAVSRLYFWNTLGGILGALAAGFWLIPIYNVQNTLLIVMALSLAWGGVLAARDFPVPAWRWAAPAGAAVFMAVACLQLRGRHLTVEALSAWLTHGDLEANILRAEDDEEASVAVISRGGSTFLSINGVGVAGHSNPTKLMAHIPLLIHPHAEKTLVICFGIGTTFRSALHHPGRVTAVDLVPGVLRAFQFFYPDWKRWAGDPRALRLVNDGRNHLLREKEGYDVVIVDPSPPLYAAGTVNLYSKDFFALARRRLRPGGIAAVWVPDYPESEFLMIMKSFLVSFPHTQVWRCDAQGRGVLLLGSDTPMLLDRALIAKRLKEPEIRRDLLEFNKDFEKEAAFWSLYMGPGERFREMLSGVREVSDDFPWIEYPFFRSLDRKAYLRSPAFFNWPPYKGA